MKCEFFIFLVAFVLSKTYFYVSPNSTVCGTGAEFCSVHQPCPFFCPYQQNSFIESSDVTILISPGTYDLTSMDYNPPYGAFEEKGYFYVYMAELSQEKLSLSLEVHRESSEASQDHEDMEEAIIEGYFMSDVFKNYPECYGSINLFYLNSDHVSLNMSGITIRNLLPYSNPDQSWKGFALKSSLILGRSQFDLFNSDPNPNSCVDYSGMDFQFRFSHMKFQNLSFLFNFSPRKGEISHCVFEGMLQAITGGVWLDRGDLDFKISHSIFKNTQTSIMFSGLFSLFNFMLCSPHRIDTPTLKRISFNVSHTQFLDISGVTILQTNLKADRYENIAFDLLFSFSHSKFSGIQPAGVHGRAMSDNVFLFNIDSSSFQIEFRDTEVNNIITKRSFLKALPTFNPQNISIWGQFLFDGTHFENITGGTTVVSIKAVITGAQKITPPYPAVVIQGCRFERIVNVDNVVEFLTFLWNGEVFSRVSKQEFLKMMEISHSKFLNNIVLNADIYVDSKGEFIEPKHFQNMCSTTTGGMLSITNSRFEGSHGTAVLVENCDRIEISESVFLGNRNGAVYLSGDQDVGCDDNGPKRIFVTDSAFIDNFSPIGGGAITLDDISCPYDKEIYGSIEGNFFGCGIISSYFKGNRADHYGGAIFAKRSQTSNFFNPLPSTIGIFNTTFVSNEAVFGGAMFLDDGFDLCVIPNTNYLGYHNIDLTHWVNVSLVRFHDNTASSAGGAVYVKTKKNMYGHRWKCNETSVFTDFSRNYIYQSPTQSVKNSVSTYPVAISFPYGKENNCSEFIDKNNWRCDLNAIQVIDYDGTVLNFPAFEENLIEIFVFEKGNTISFTLSTKDREVSSKSRQISFYADYDKFSGGKVKAQVTFLGVVYETSLKLERKDLNNISIMAFSIAMASMTFLIILICVCACVCIAFICSTFLVLFVLLFLLCGGCSACVFCASIRSLRTLQKRKKDDEIAEEMFSRYPDLDTINNTPNEEIDSPSERSSLLDPEKKETKLGKHHVFVGSKNGFGTIFFVERKSTNSFSAAMRGPGKLFFPVFLGMFKNGQKNGEGVEFFFNRKNYVQTIRFWAKNQRSIQKFATKFRGVYKNDRRHGFGTEYKNDIHDNSKRLMGNWSNGSLTRIFSIDFPLQEFDLQRDVAVLGKIGRGGFSNIYRAKYKNQDVALKVFGDRRERFEPSEHTGYPNRSINSEQYSNNLIGGLKVFEKIRRAENYERSENIGGILKRISSFKHPNIVEVHGWTGPKFLESEFAYLMELCACSVRDFFLKNKKSANKKKLILKDKILLGCAQGMQCFHDQIGFIHRDLKLSNLLLDSTDEISMTVKICDFNLGMEDFRKEKRTEFHFAGSPFNCAPESFIDGDYSRFCDVYSFGVMMYELYEDKVDDPLDILKTKKCPICREKMDMNNLMMEMKKHHIKHEKIGLFPDIMKEREEEEEEDGEDSDSDSDEDWRIELCRRCLMKDPGKRPSFLEIVSIYRMKR